MANVFQPLIIGQIRQLGVNAVAASPSTTAAVSAAIAALDAVSNSMSSSCFPAHNTNLLEVLQFNGQQSVIAVVLLQAILGLSTNQPS